MSLHQEPPALTSPPRFVRLSSERSEAHHPCPPAWRTRLAALIAYAVLALLFIDHGVSPNQHIFGFEADSFAYIWFLAWFPWAAAHHLNPLWSHFAWQPLGQALMWACSVPLLCTLAAPLTLSLGPVVTFNLLVIADPALSAWCMYLLGARLGASWQAAFIGGFLFGFSSYEMGQAATLNLGFTFLLPCIGLIVAARLQGAVNRPGAIALITLVGVCQFLISSEIFALFLLFGAGAWLLALSLLPAWRAGLRRLALDAALAAPAVAVILSPFFWAMTWQYPYMQLPSNWPEMFSALPTGFFIPGPNTLLSWPPAWRMNNKFMWDVSEHDTYLGLPLIAIAYLYARQNWRLPPARVLCLIGATLALLSLGPSLELGAHLTPIILPWSLLMRLPLMSNALPVRFGLYVSFITALIAVRWIDSDPAKQRQRLAAGLLACLVIMPIPFRTLDIPQARFFAPGRESQVLGPDKQLLLLPFGGSGPSSYWQVESGFSFSQTGGYLGSPPRAMQHFAAIGELGDRTGQSLTAADLADFVQTTKTDYIVAGPGTPTPLIVRLETLHWRERQIDDVLIFDVPPANPAP